MADTPNGDRPSLRPSLRPSHRPDTLSALLDKPLTDEGKVLDALVGGLSTGESTPELFNRLHDAAMQSERVANLSFAYERVARDNRIKLLPKPRQAEFFLAAARFFGDVFGDIDAGVGFAERAHQIAPDDPVVFDQLETLLASAQQGTKLAKLYSDSAARAKERSEKVRLLRAAIELLEAFNGSPDDVLALYRQLVEQDPEDKGALETLERLYLAARRFKELAELLEKSIAKDSTIPVAVSDEIRLRLLGLYRGELRDPTKAAPHVEVLLSREPIGPAALQAAEALIDHRPVAPRIAPLLSEAYRRLGRHEDEASTLALELKLARAPRLPEVHRRLAILRQDVLGDPSGALELLEPLVARDPAEDELRRRYLEVSVTFHREVEAAKLLARAISTSKDVAVRSRVGLEIATLYAKQGDVRRARATLEPLVEESESDAARLPIAKRLVELHQDGVDPKGLAQVLAVVIRIDPDLAGRMSAARRLAELCEGPVDDPKLAVVAYRVLVGSPRGDEALDKLAALYEKLGDDAGTIDLLTERALRAKDPEKAKAFAFRAAELKAARAPDRARAIEAWSDLVRAQGPSREVLAKLAALLEQQRDFRELTSVLTSSLVLATKEERPALHARIAKIRLTELREPALSLEALRAALELDPREPVARRLAEKLLGDGEHRLAAAAVLEPAYRAEGNHAGIVRILETRAELDASPAGRLSLLEEACRIAETELAEPRRALDLAGRALAEAARHRIGDVPRWLERFRRAAVRASEPSRRAELLSAAVASIPIDRPEAAELGREAAEALVTAGEVGRALEVYRLVLAFEPSSAELLRRVDELLAEQGSPEERVLLYRAALERATDEHRRRELLHAIAMIQRRDLRDLRGAVETLRLLVEGSPADVAVHEALVECLGALGDHAALSAELERALSFVEGERRTTTMLELARRRAEGGDHESALALYRKLVASDDLPVEAFKTVALLAEAASDAETLAEVLERTALRTSDEREQVESLEKLGEVRGAQLGDAKGAVAAFRRAATLSRDLEGEQGRAVRLFERVLDAEPDDREAARFLVDAYASSGRWAKVPAVFAVILRADTSHEPVEVLFGLEERATRARAVDELLAMADEALARKTQDAGRRSRDLMALKARALAAVPSRRAEAAAILRGLVETHAEVSDVEAFRRFLSEAEDEPSTFAEQRWLFAFRVEHTNDPGAVLWEWVLAEEHRMHDPKAAVRVLEELLNLDPSRSDALEALCRIQLARGEADALLKELASLRARVPVEDALDVELRIAALLVEQLGRAGEAMPLVEAALQRSPGNLEALRVARSALRQPGSRRESAALLAAVAASAEGASGEALLTALLDESRGADDLGPARAGWYARLVELLVAEPARALAVAVQAAEEMPEERSLWDAAERLARRAGDPRSVADAYDRTLSRELPEALGEVVGQRFVEFQEEWFDEPEAALRLLERVLQISPRARWALDRIKLAYNADARWNDLFGLYDRAIAGATDPHEQVDLLDEAALAAKDLANDSDRAISYLERLQQVRPEARVESMLERLYDRTGRARELILLLEKRVGSVSGADLARLEARLARLRLDLGEVEEAFALIGRVLVADPEEPTAYALLERLVKVPGAPSVIPPGRSSPPGKSVPPARKGASAKKPKKRVDKAAPKNVRQEAARLLEERYRKTGDLAGQARAMEAALEIAETVKEVVRRHEELLALYQGHLPDPERAFEHLCALVRVDPKSTSYRGRLAAVTAELGAEERRAAMLTDTADGLADPSVRIGLYREAAKVLSDIGNHEAAAASHSRVLALSEGDPKVTLESARTLETLLAGLGRHAERCDVLERIVAVERDPKGKRDALALVAQIAFDDLGDPDRAARAFRTRLADDPKDREALDGLERVLTSAGRHAELVQVLTRRVALSSGTEARADRVRIARLLAGELGDAPAAIEAWRSIRRDLGPDEESYAALAALLESRSRWRELAELVEEAAEATPAGADRAAAYRQLGDLHRDRTSEPVLALRAYVAAGDFQSTITTLEHVSDRDTVVRVAETLLGLCVDAWPGADAALGASIAAAAHVAVEALVRRHLEDGSLPEVVETQLRGAALPFERTLRRKLRRDAAFTSSDRLDNQDQAIRILHELFAEDPSDEIAAASVTRFARLLDEAGRHAELALLWEQQAKVRAESGDRAGAAALWARAAAIWETSLNDVERAISVHRQGAGLGGEVSLEALARIYRARKNHRAAAMALEWLSAQSTREALAPRVLDLADTYLSLGEWERARARLEHAAATAIEAGAVRLRLGELYRQHREWEPLVTLLVAEAERAPDDKRRLALLREAANLNFNERAQPALAVPLLERAVELDPEEPALRLALSEALRASGRFDAAAAVLRTQIERYGHRRPKDRALVHLYLARVALAAGSRAEALGELDTGAKINPAHPGILYELGRLALEEGQLARAERTYRALLLVLRKPDGDAGEAPGRAEIYLDLSEIAARQGENDRAFELVESAFEAALDSAADSASLEKALRKAGRYDLLARAIESRLGAATEPVSAARALSDLVMLESERGDEGRSSAGRVQGEAGRIFRDLEARRIGDPGAWAAMTSVYEWLGDPTHEAKALEHRVEAQLAAGADVEVEPLLRLSRIRLADASQRDHGVALAEKALDSGADPDHVWALLHQASAATPPHHGVLRLLERIAREPGRERALVEVVALRADAGSIDADVVRDVAVLARRFGEREAEVRMLRGALAHATLDPMDAAWLRERLARLLIQDGATAAAADLLEAAAAVADPDHGRALSLEVAGLAADELAEPDRAAGIYRRLLETDAADREAWEPLLELYRARGERERLIALIGATAPHVASAADRGRLRFEEATLMLAEPERTDAAIALLESVVGEEPSLQEAAELLATLLERQGRLGELVALTATQLDAAKSTGDAAVVEALSLKVAALLERDGRSDEALRAFWGALDWNPESREALRAVVRLESAPTAPPAGLADAIERLLAVEEADQRSPLSRRLIALRTEEGDAAGLERALEAACAADPMDPELREQLVARCLERDDWRAAARVLQRAAEADTSDFALLQRAVEAYERGGDLARAVEALGLAGGRTPGDPEVHLERARLLTLLGRHDEALVDVEAAHAAGGTKIPDLTLALEAAIERSEGAVRAAHTLRLADLLESAGETGQAREHLVQLLKLLPKHPEALRRLASLAAAEARWDEAAATYRRLIALEDGPALVDAAMNLADACEHSGHLADARGGLERALETMPESAEIRARLRQLYETTGATRELAHLLLKEGRAETDVGARTSALLRAAALLLERDGDAAEAIGVLTEVRKLSPESIQGAVLLARAHAALGKSHDALVALEEVVAAHRGRRSRDLALVHREISNVHLESGSLTLALEALSKAFDLDMRNGELAMQLGHLALDVDDTETATKAFRSVTMMKLKTPGTVEGASAESKAVAYYHLSRIAQAQGDVRKARLMASKAVSENPNHAEAQALLKELRI